jgi:hypothetical protein
MRDLLERLATKEPGVLWALVAIVVGYAIWAIWADRRRARHDRPARKR